MRTLRNLLILGAIAGALTGCAWRNLGPCYGIGCPAWSGSSAPPQKSASAPAAKVPGRSIAQARPARSAPAAPPSGQ